MKEEWKKVKLSEIADYVSERILLENLSEDDYISTENMLAGKNGITKCATIPEASAVPRYVNGDVLVSNIRPYFKKIWYADRIGGCSNDVIVFRVKDGKKVDSKYLYYLLSQDAFFDHMMAGANGTKMPRGNKKLIPNFESLAFPLSTQQKVASILSAYDDLIENNRKQIKLLEEAAQKLYKEWFVKLNFPGHENTKIVDGIPEGWKKEKVGNLISTLSKTKQIKTSEIKKTGKIPVIDQSRDFIAGYTDDLESLISPKNPVIVFGDHTRILKLIQFPFARGADGTQTFISINENIQEYQLYCALIEIDLSSYSYARHFKYLKEELVFVPTKEISNRFESFATSSYKMIQKLRDQIQLLQFARDKLLPKLMNGEIEV